MCFEEFALQEDYKIDIFQMVLGQLATLTVIMDVETRCDLLAVSAKSAADPFYIALLGSVWSR